VGFVGQVVGREAELRAVRALVDDAARGHGGVLALVGPPGIGKSMLLDSATDDPGATTALRVVGVEAERELPFAGLWSLVLPLLGHEDALTPAQRRALEVVTGRAEGAAPGPMIVGGALLALLSAAAERQPVVVVVDDLHWVDRTSAQALLFAARRLRAERVAVLLASRPPEPLDPDGLGPVLRSVPVLALSGLAPDDARRLLPDAAAEVAATLAERTGGNPLAMVEAAALLPPEVRSGRRPLPHSLPPSSADETYRLRLGRLTPAAREGCRVMALAGRAPGDLVVEALSKLALSVDDLRELEGAGLARLGVDGVKWRHPLARSAAADGAVDQVRRIHAVLAECWSSVPGSSPQWAWHRAEAVPGPDQAVAEALADVARASAGRDASLEAADAWERAAQLGEDPGLRRQWLGLAAGAAFRGGAAARAARLYDAALEGASASSSPGVHPDVAVLLRERGRVEHGLGRPTHAYGLFMSASRASTGRLAVWAAAEAVHSGMYARRPDLAREAATAACAAHDPSDPVQRFLVLHADGAASALGGDDDSARQLMACAQGLLRDERLLEAEPDLLLWAVNADLFLAGVPPPLHPTVLEALGRMRESGELVWSPRVVRLIGVRDLLQGSWGAALAAFEEASELARLAGQPTQVAEALLLQADIEAVRGLADACLAHTAEAGAIVTELEVRWLADQVWVTRGLLHLTLDEPARAAECFARCPDEDEVATDGLVESLLTVGRRDAAAQVLAGRGDPDASRSVARCLLDDDEAAARHLVEHAAAADTAFEGARRRLAAGAILRRAGARSDGRHQLRLAEEAFSSMGATPWLERARSELRASGATLRRGPEGLDLTPGELRVATLVAQGRSNKDVAAALFLSTKTVEFHLGRAYRKLGVANRTALAARLAELREG